MRAAFSSALFLTGVAVVVGRVTLGLGHHSPVFILPFLPPTTTIAIPAITSIVPSTSGQATGLADQDDRRGNAASNGVPSMPSERDVSGGSARATETAAQVPVGPAITPTIRQRHPELGLG